MKNILVYLVLLIGFGAFAQQARITGIVMDGEDDDQPLAFAEIKIKGTSIGTSTDLHGAFTLELLPGTYTFLVEFVGYETREIRGLVLTDKNLSLTPVIMTARQRLSPMVASSEQ